MALAFRRGGLVARTVDGRWTWTHLAADFLNPSPTDPNLASSAEAARSVVATLGRLEDGVPFNEAVVAIPDRAAHAALTDQAGAGGLRRLRSDLVAALTASAGPTPAAIDRRFRFGALPSGPRRRRSVLGAVSGASVVHQYETAVEAAGPAVRWVDAVSLAVLPEWLASPASAAWRALALLHPRHFVLVVAEGFRLTGFRMRLRARLDPDPVVLAARRLAADGAAPGFAVWGDGAGAVAERLGEAGITVDEVRSASPPSEGGPALSPVLDESLQALLRRVGARPAPLSGAPVPSTERVEAPPISPRAAAGP